MKHLLTYFKNTNPTSVNNVGANYSLGQEWYNTVTGEKFYHMTDGVWVKSMTSVSSLIISITKGEIDTLITGSLLIPGATYKISGVHPSLYNDGTNSGSTIFLKALTTNKLDTDGSGLFYNPKYDKTVIGFNVWSELSTWTAAIIPLTGTGNFNTSENVTADNGATGYLVGGIYSGIFIANTGNWLTATTITGNVTNTSANISAVAIASYGAGDKAIWGGYSWTNISGSLGASANILELDEGWTKDPYDEVNYNLVSDLISYDYENDLIIKRHEVESDNIVIATATDLFYFNDSWGLLYSAISVFMWGNPLEYSNTAYDYIGIGRNKVINSYFECVDFRGARIADNELDGLSVIYDNTMIGERNNIWLNKLYESYIYNNITNTGTEFYGNVLLLQSEISDCVTNNFTYFHHNELSSYSKIGNNFGYDGYFGKNILDNGSSVTYNTLVSGEIHDNALSRSYITTSTLKSSSHINSINMGNSYIRNANFNFSNFKDSTMVNSTVNFQLSGTFSSKNMSMLDFRDSQVTDNFGTASIIFGTYSKSIFMVEGGSYKLGYYNSFGSFIIQNINI